MTFQTPYHPSAREEAYGIYLLRTVFQVSPDYPDFRVGGRQAVPFLSQSTVNRLILRNIWNVADPSNVGHLSSPQQFYIILRLVALAQYGPLTEALSMGYQKGLSPSQALQVCLSQTSTMQYPLAAFQGVSIPDESTLRQIFLQYKHQALHPSASNPALVGGGSNVAVLPGTGTALPVAQPQRVSIDEAFSGLVEVEDSPLQPSWIVSGDNINAQSPIDSHNLVQASHPEPATWATSFTASLNQATDISHGNSTNDTFDSKSFFKNDDTTGQIPSPSLSHNAEGGIASTSQTTSGPGVKMVPTSNSDLSSVVPHPTTLLSVTDAFEGLTPNNPGKHAVLEQTTSLDGPTVAVTNQFAVAFSDPVSENIIQPSIQHEDAVDDFGEFLDAAPAVPTTSAIEDTYHPTVVQLPPVVDDPFAGLTSTPSFNSGIAFEGHGIGNDALINTFGTNIAGGTPDASRDGMPSVSMQPQSDVPSNVRRWDAVDLLVTGTNATEEGISISKAEEIHDDEDFGDFTAVAPSISNTGYGDGEHPSTNVDASQAVSGWDALDALVQSQDPIIPPLLSGASFSIAKGDDIAAPATSTPSHEPNQLVDEDDFGDFESGATFMDSAQDRSAIVGNQSATFQEDMPSMRDDSIQVFCPDINPTKGEGQSYDGAREQGSGSGQGITFAYSADSDFGQRTQSNQDSVFRVLENDGVVHRQLVTTISKIPTGGDLGYRIDSAYYSAQTRSDSVFSEEFQDAQQYHEAKDSGMQTNTVDLNRNIDQVIRSTRIPDEDPFAAFDVIAPTSPPIPPLSSFGLEQCVSEEDLSLKNSVPEFHAAHIAQGDIFGDLTSVNHVNEDLSGHPLVQDGVHAAAHDDDFGDFSGVAGKNLPNIAINNLTESGSVQATDDGNKDQSLWVDKGAISIGFSQETSGGQDHHDLFEFNPIDNPVPRPAETTSGQPVNATEMGSFFGNVIMESEPRIEGNEDSSDFGDFAGFGETSIITQEDPNSGTANAPQDKPAHGFCLDSGAKNDSHNNDTNGFGGSLEFDEISPTQPAIGNTIMLEKAVTDSYKKPDAGIVKGCEDDDDFGNFSGFPTSTMIVPDVVGNSEVGKKSIIVCDSLKSADNGDFAKSTAISGDGGDHHDDFGKFADYGDTSPELISSATPQQIMLVAQGPTMPENGNDNVATLSGPSAMLDSVLSQNKTEENDCTLYDDIIVKSPEPIPTAHALNDESSTFIGEPPQSELKSVDGKPAQIYAREEVVNNDLGVISFEDFPVVESPNPGIDQNSEFAAGEFTHDFGDFVGFNERTAPDSAIILDSQLQEVGDQVSPPNEYSTSIDESYTSTNNRGALVTDGHGGFEPVPQTNCELLPESPECQEKKNLMALRELIHNKSLRLPELIRRQIGGKGVVLDFRDVFDANIGMEIPLSSERDARAQRCLQLMALLTTSHSKLASTYWNQAYSIAKDELSLGSFLMDEIADLSPQALVLVRMKVETYLYSLGEIVRVCRSIAATIGDLLMLDPSSLMTIDTLTSSWCSLDLLKEYLNIEKSWKELEAMASHVGIRDQRKKGKLECLTEIRQRSAAKPVSGSRLCHFTLQPLSRKDKHAAYLGTKTPVVWNGHKFMACAANFLANKYPVYQAKDSQG